jgi:predicted RNA-binding Zn-ribbon protein involved in translation (DUF1610 family)
MLIDFTHRSNQSKVKLTIYTILYSVAREDNNTCPECGVGKMKPSGGIAKISDPDTGTVARDYQEYKCDNCGYPEGARAKVAANDQAAISESTDPATTNADSGGRSDNPLNPT